MAAKAVLITHGGDGPQGNDHASGILAKLGYQLDWYQPDQGDVLPKIDESVAITLIYGGAKPEDERDWYTARYPWLHVEIAFAKECIANQIPTVGFCLGGQIIAHVLGATIEPHPQGMGEFGYYPLTSTEQGKGFFPDNFRVTQCHYHGFSAPSGATILAHTQHFAHQAFAHGNTTYGFQFHPECSLENFQRWQHKNRTLYDRSGAQTREEQDRLGRPSHESQAVWLDHFLTKLVGPSNFQR